MRRSRQFRPDSLAPMEDRVVLSTVTPTVLAANVNKATLVPLNSTTPTAEGPTKGIIGNYGGKDIAQTGKIRRLLRLRFVSLRRNTLERRNQLIGHFFLDARVKLTFPRL